MTEMQHRGGVWNRITVQLDAGKAAQRLTVVQRILQRFVSKPVPLLQKINTQHPLQADRRPAALALRIKRPQPLDQPRPGNHLFHLGEKLVAPRLPFL